MISLKNLAVLNYSKFTRHIASFCPSSTPRPLSARIKDCHRLRLLVRNPPKILEKAPEWKLRIMATSTAAMKSPRLRRTSGFTSDPLCWTRASLHFHAVAIERLIQGRDQVVICLDDRVVWRTLTSSFANQPPCLTRASKSLHCRVGAIERLVQGRDQPGIGLDDRNVWRILFGADFFFCEMR